MNSKRNQRTGYYLGAVAILGIAIGAALGFSLRNWTLGIGVGVAAIQIAKHLGAKVIATSGSEVKCRRLRQLGADMTIDVSEHDFLPEVMRITGNRGVDVVLEMIGGEVYQKSLQALAPGSRVKRGS